MSGVIDGTRAGLLRAVLEAPDDPDRRLVYADYLEEYGLPGEEKFANAIRAGVALLRQGEWRPAVVTLTDGQGFDYVAGFPSAWRCTRIQYLLHAREVFARHPVTDVFLSDPEFEPHSVTSRTHAGDIVGALPGQPGEVGQNPASTNPVTVWRVNYFFAASRVDYPRPDSGLGHFSLADLRKLRHHLDRHLLARSYPSAALATNALARVLANFSRKVNDLGELPVPGGEAAASEI